MAHLRAMRGLQTLGKLTLYHNARADGQGCLLGNEKKQSLEDLQAQEGPVEHGCRKIRSVGIDEEASFLCSKCRDDPRCLVCHKDKLPKDTQGDKTDVNDKTKPPAPEVQLANGDGLKHSQPTSKDKNETEEEDHDMDEDDSHGHLRFRCFRCKQEAHYEHCKLTYLFQSSKLTSSNEPFHDGRHPTSYRRPLSTRD
jgi:hypothetical protein